MAGAGPLTALTPAQRDGMWTADTAWENPDLTLRFATGVLAGDVLFGLSGRNAGQYFAVDAKTGKTLWTSEGRQAQHASIARVGEHFVIMQGNGELIVAKNSPTAFEPIRRYKVAETDTWTQAAYSGNRILVKDVSNLMLYTLN
jgi:hypothetical protein